MPGLAVNEVHVSCLYKEGCRRYPSQKVWCVGRLTTGEMTARNDLRRTGLLCVDIAECDHDVQTVTGQRLRSCRKSGQICQERKEERIVDVPVNDPVSLRRAERVLRDDVAIRTEYLFHNGDDGLQYQQVPESVVELEHPHQAHTTTQQVTPWILVNRWVSVSLLDQFSELPYMVNGQHRPKYHESLGMELMNDSRVPAVPDCRACRLLPHGEPIRKLTVLLFGNLGRHVLRTDPDTLAEVLVLLGV